MRRILVAVAGGNADDADAVEIAIQKGALGQRHGGLGPGLSRRTVMRYQRDRRVGAG
jgi:hypothetical protein